MISPDSNAGSNKQILQNSLAAITLLYVFCSFFWLGRQTTILTDEPLKPLRQLWFFFGLEQDWRLFGPELRTFNCFPSAIITIDGAKFLWEGPHYSETLAGNACRLNLHRKFCVDYLPWKLYSGYWPSFSGTLAREFVAPGWQPDSVSLLLSTEEMPAPEKEFRRRDHLPSYGQLSVYYEKFKDRELVP